MATTLQMQMPHSPPLEHVPTSPIINDRASLAYLRPIPSTSPIPAVADSSTTSTYPKRLTTNITDLDLRDSSRYPGLPSASSPRPPSQNTSPYQERYETSPVPSFSRRSWFDYPQTSNAYTPTGWVAEKLTEEPVEQEQSYAVDQIQQVSQQQQSRPLSPAQHQQQQQVSSPRLRSYSVPQASPTYELNSGADFMPMNNDARNESDFSRIPQQQQQQDMGQRMSSNYDGYRERPIGRASPLPELPIGAAVPGPSTTTLTPIVPLSAGPSFDPASLTLPVTQSPRAYAQQPTYIKSSTPNPAYAPAQVPKEEVCAECAMRDQDMADVDVTSPGVWERESDALYEDLIQRELEDEAGGIPFAEIVASSRPRSKGDLLTETNLKLWMTMNPKEPSSRLHALEQYAKAQRGLLEAEALAHARSARESRMLDERMRDAYTQLRRSAYELGVGGVAQPDDSGGLRIKPPHSPTVPSGLGMHGHSREVTLLENGMIVEHVDVRKEEREERERRRKEERRERSRARKSSRSSRSGADVMSVYSLQNGPPHPTDSGFFSGVGVNKSDSRYSQSLAARPSSVLTAGDNGRPQTLLRAQSQASFSDMQSIMSSGTSPRISRFFGFKNHSTSWRSQESFAPSGSMIDMHLALAREQQYLAAHPRPIDIGSNTPTLRVGDSWVQPAQSPEPKENAEPKKAKGLKKIWKMMTGSSAKSDAHGSSRRPSTSMIGTDDDQPLTPPPPLSYLVNQKQGIVSSRRHVSTPSLPSAISPNALYPHAPSPPPPVPSSSSPTSSRPSGPEKDNSGNEGHVISDYDSSQSPDFDRGRTTRSSSRTLSSMNGPLTPGPTPSIRPMSTMLQREKSLPPIPTAESSVEFPNHPMPDQRPLTVFTYDPRGMPYTPDNSLAPPQAGFRTTDARRQSFGGVSSGPHSAVRSLPLRPNGQTNPSPLHNSESGKYNEFGLSRNSIAQWANAQYSQPTLQLPPQPEETPRKRKSRFFSSLFGKKSHGHGYGSSNDFKEDPYSSSLPYVVDGDGMTAVNADGYASPRSGRSLTMPRMSIASHRNIDLVDQDKDFIAYRYPSKDQRLDLAR